MKSYPAHNSSGKKKSFAVFRRAGRKAVWARAMLRLSAAGTVLGLACLAGAAGESENVDKKEEGAKPVMNEAIRVCLPDKVDAVVGDTLEIFYKSVIAAADPLRYNIRVLAPKGKRYAKKWLYAAQAGDSDFTLTLEVWDDFGKRLGAAETQVKVWKKPESPDHPVNVLCIGASETRGGQWVRELRRRLCETGGTPAGDGLTNVQFIGSCGTDASRYEGYGGWSWRGYLGHASVTSNAWIYPTAGMKTDPASQHSTWRDPAGGEWMIETLDIQGNRLKMRLGAQAKPGQKMPTAGRLEWVAGGPDQTPIEYASVQPEKGNPFWSSNLGKVDFADYLRRNKIEGGIDFCYVILGWNDYSGSPRVDGKADVTGVLEAAERFIDALHAAFPKCVIVILSSTPGDPDGCGENYSFADLKWDPWSMTQGLFDTAAGYQKIARSPARSSYMDYVNLACQYDSENGPLFAEKPPSLRAKNKVKVCINGLHPSLEGYLMIADAIYRNLAGKLNGIPSLPAQSPAPK